MKVAPIFFLVAFVHHEFISKRCLYDFNVKLSMCIFPI